MPSAFAMKLIGGLAGLLALLGLIAGLKHYKSLAERRGESLATICTATRAASNVPKLKCGDVPAQISFLGEALNAVRAKTAKAQADDAAHAKAVETQQTQIGQESSRDYQAELARVRADYAERLRRASAANSGGGGKPSVPGASAGSSGSDAAAAQGGLPSPDALTATEQALQLQALQDWARKEGLAK